jgi:hypothetical protein
MNARGTATLDAARQVLCVLLQTRAHGRVANAQRAKSATRDALL